VRDGGDTTVTCAKRRIRTHAASHARAIIRRLLPSRPLRLLAVAAAAIALALYAAMLFRNIDYAVGGADSSGYMSEARMMAEGRLGLDVGIVRTLQLDPSFARLFVPIGFREAPGARIVPAYPAGLPAHFALAALVGGWERAPFWVSALSAIGAVLLVFLVARELGLSAWGSAAAAAMLAALPVVISTAVQPLSDDLATFWALLAVWCALRARRAPLLAVAAGAAFGVGVWVRPTNILVALPLAFAVRWNWRLLLRLAAGAIPLGLGLMWWNDALFGSPFVNGYGNVRDLVSTGVWRKCGGHHLRELTRALSLVVPLGAALTLLVPRVARWDRALLASWFGVFFAFYASYDICTDWWDMRFLLPALPAMFIAFILLFDHRRQFVLAVAALLLVAFVVRRESLQAKELGVLGYAERERIWPETARWAAARIPQRAVVISGIYGGAVLYYTGHLTARWDFMDAYDSETLQSAAAAAHLPCYALISAIADANDDEFRRRIPGNWEVVDVTRDVTLYRIRR
jgi:hypothetical protein